MPEPIAHPFNTVGSILLCVMPTSVATYLWVDLYRPEDAPTVASLILISTLASVIVLPVVLTV